MKMVSIRRLLVAGVFLIGGWSRSLCAEEISVADSRPQPGLPAESPAIFAAGLWLPSNSDLRLHDAAHEGRLRRAVAGYLRDVEAIERRAAEERAAARARLLEVLGEEVSGLPARIEPGLIGGSTINGERAGVVFHYHHGRLLAAEQIRSRFHSAEPPFPDVRIELVGYINVPRDMTVKIWHAAGGVNLDHGELTIDGRLVGTVGDDLVKNVIYVVKFPQGTHQVRWVLTGGTFQNNLLKFEDPQTGHLLDVFHDAGQRELCGVDSAREIVEADRDPGEWSIAVDPQQWSWEVVAR